MFNTTIKDKYLNQFISNILDFISRVKSNNIKNKFIVYTIFEGNNSTNSKLFDRPNPDYNKELIRYYNTMNKFNKLLNNFIEFKIIIPKKNIDLNEISKKLNTFSLNIEILELPELQNKKIHNGFDYIILGGKYLEEKYPKKIIIHNDIDMELLNLGIFSFIDNIFLKDKTSIIVGNAKLDYIDIHDIRHQDDEYFIADTCFIASLGKNNYYSLWWDTYIRLNNIAIPNKKILERTYLNLDSFDYYLEEISMDYLINTKLKNKLTSLDNFQFGEGYNYLDTIHIKYWPNIYYKHEHIYINKSNRINNLKSYKQEKIFFKRPVINILNNLESRE